MINDDEKIYLLEAISATSARTFRPNAVPRVTCTCGERTEAILRDKIIVSTGDLAWLFTGVFAAGVLTGVLARRIGKPYA